MDTNRQRIGEREQRLAQALTSASIRALAAAHGTSQTDLGQALGISQTAVSKKIRGVTAWSLTDVRLLAAHYGATVDQITAGPWAWLGLPDDLGALSA